ncbi:thermonuclease family protein [Kordiimonas lacus]|uniref:Endonuclease YncB, thermonuclease family n=1 Tax=Kordiimonas lacus TaxID=637679 RepID=A0A1G6TXZ4_9PROT|nr:thermonuclease family protein [Kordiimonas lacus]SDD33970.1 Endonuclease YncB, thermonuclease family [Kordiimonas lacus]
MMPLRAILILGAMLAGQAAGAVELDLTGLEDCGTVTAQGAIGGARFTTNGGQVVKLALVKAPELWKKGDPYRSWPHAEAARDALIALTDGQEISLYCEGGKTNREGELVAHALLADGRWLQHVLVEGGNVFVFPRPTRRRGLETLYRTEDAARAEGKGLWAYDNMKTVDALGSGVRTGWFQIVEGSVVAANQVGTTLYLNFGEDWRTDFTVEIPSTALRHFGKAKIDPLTFEGRRVEVRGWIDFKGGPRLLLQGPGQLRLMKDKTAQ